MIFDILVSQRSNMHIELQNELKNQPKNHLVYLVSCEGVDQIQSQTRYSAKSGVKYQRTLHGIGKIHADIFLN